jgi:hypothetical protein
VSGFVAGGVSDADLEHVVGELLETLLVEVGAVLLESVVCCSA